MRTAALVYSGLVLMLASGMTRPAAALLASACFLSAAEPHFFETKVRPLLAAKCYACHTDSQMGGLRLDSRETILRGGSRGAAVVPGDPGDSLLLKAIRRTREDLKMPPAEALTATEVAVLEEWIAAGAPWSEAMPAVADASTIAAGARQFWSFQPVRRPAVPDGETASPIDAFLLEKLKAAGLEPAPLADKRTLIRRVTLDLLGLPPTPEETAAFLADDSTGAYPRLVDRLLESQHYGERLARRWLDLARYADGQSSAYEDTPLPNAWRYRDWVVDAFNRDLPFDQFVVAQIAADLLSEPEREMRLAALGFHALRDQDDDRVDVTGQALLGLTLACAQCHDHKFDPILQSDFYALQGVFDSSEAYSHPLAPAEQVEVYESAKKSAAEQELAIDLFLERERNQLIDVLMKRSADFLVASYRVLSEQAEPEMVAAEANLDLETLERWLAYLRAGRHEHPYLDEWRALMNEACSLEEARRAAGEFEHVLVSIHQDKRAIEDRNYVKLGGAEGTRTESTLLNTNLEFLEPVRYYLWRDMAAPPSEKRGLPFVGGVYHYGPKQIERFLSGVWREHLERQRAELERRQGQVPAQYPFLHAYRDAETAKDARIAIRGDKKNLGPAVPRRFLVVLSAGQPAPFAQGSGRFELAQAIASPCNPLTARVFVNRLWQWRLGRGLVGTPSNFGQLGERPTHPELLDWLAAEFVESGWSIKALDRTILLSDAYRRSSRMLAANQDADADNRLLWRFNPVERLDAETVRDAMLAVSGQLDRTSGGPAHALEPENLRRTLYATVDRTNPNPVMELFDFPDSKSHAEARDVTVGPLQRLYFLNNPFVLAQSKALAERLAVEARASPEARVRFAYELLFSRPPEESELLAALAFVETDTWERYCQALLASSEFLTVR